MEYLEKKQATLIPPNLDYDFLVDYYTASDLYDFYFGEKWETALLIPKIEKAVNDDNLTKIQKYISSIINFNAFKYSKLYNTLLLEYNPLDNVNATITNSYGAISNTKVKGQQVDIHERDAKTDSTSENIGGVTTTRGANDITETNNIYGFNTSSANGVNADKKIINNGAYTDTIGQHTNANTLNYGKDKLTETYGNRSDTDSTQAHTDTITRVGNIGVTSSQELLKQEREVAIFNFYEHIFTDILNIITLGVFENEY